jgi:starch phosphorylase
VPAENGDIDEIKSAVLAKLALELGKDASVATDRDWFVAAALTIRDRIVHRWLAVDRASHAQCCKRVYYLSLEFLIGRLFADVLCNLGWAEIFRAALGDLGVDLNRLRAAEPDAALGHGGLGRLAACFMESMRPSEFLLTATAFATITDCSAKSSGTVGSRNTLRNGCPLAIHGSSRGRK